MFTFMYSQHRTIHTAPKRAKRNDGRASQRKSNGKGKGKAASQSLAELSSSSASGDGGGNDSGSDYADSIAASQSQAQSGLKLSEQEVDLLVGDLVRYLIYKDTQKQVIRKSDIKKAVFANYRQRSIVRTLLPLANAKLKEVFGFKIVELPKKEDVGLGASSAVADERSGVLALQNMLPGVLRNGIVPATEHHGLLFIVLAAIVIENGKMSSTTLWNQLKLLGISEKRNHPYFGNVGRLITGWTSQMYLQANKTGEKDGAAVMEYRWGPRAKVEFEPDARFRKNALLMISEITGEPVDPILMRENEPAESSESESESESESGEKS